MELLLKVFRIALGWSVIFALVYIYVYTQKNLIADLNIFFSVIIAGTSLAFIFSALEASLLNIDIEVDKMPILIESQKNIEELKMQGLDKKRGRHLAKIQNRNQKIIDIICNDERHVAPLVISGNVLSILVASFLPSALQKTENLSPLTFDFSWLSELVRFSSYSVTLPGAGTQTLTFFSAALILIVFGKIVPKKLGKTYKIQFISFFRGLITFQTFMLGWLGEALLIIVDAVEYLIGLFRRLSGSAR
ncbi:hypothetical protein [Pseudomonas putida]|uniref:hypothetical protein n=1 Tax=Pseudomonas putida TaxID=303 RepID=UPI0023639216|nr:hypothetical protein [Pseudomonas putida]MDD2003622.1 hypothetical protein [Pseudomonas putida]